MFFDRGGNPISIQEFERLFVQEDYQVLAQTTIRGWSVSTVWLGINHGWGGAMAIFETMIFPPGDELDFDAEDSVMGERYCARHATESQALQGHEDAVKWITDRISAPSSTEFGKRTEEDES